MKNEVNFVIYDPNQEEGMEKMEKKDDLCEKCTEEENGRRLVALAEERKISIDEIIDVYDNLRRGIYDDSRSRGQFKFYDPLLEDQTFELTRDYFECTSHIKNNVE